MSVHIERITYHSAGVGKLTEQAREQVNEWRTKMLVALQAGGISADEAKAMINVHPRNGILDRLEFIAAGQTVTVRMTIEEFEEVRQALGMQLTNIH